MSSENGDMLETVITYLEMTAPPKPVHLAPAAGKLAFMLAEHPTVSFYRYLYNTVGEPWLWYERRVMGDPELLAIIDDPQVDIYVLYADGVPAGFAELDRRSPPDIELAYFGLIPEFVGRGLGPFLLRQAIEEAWTHEPDRLWVHTCTLDHPKALAVYQRAGFAPYRQETKTFPDPRASGLLPAGDTGQR
ncbi:MAG: GNAT family N-acetyltransferase [Alphaproteobacteria bacterium]|nr:GNAT family N-acetyltransferase [Alphaproteobacteria bacterium]